MVKNIHVLPTDKLSIIGFDSVKNLHFTNDFIDDYQNIYITSDEEIKVGDWVIYLYGTIIHCVKIRNKGDIELANIENSGVFKIILTTDVDLIKDGVQAIDDEFLEWFVKNPSCEEVGVKKESEFYRSGSKICGYSIVTYKIIIPEKITRCCGRCNGVDDLCYSDMTCDNHKERGCIGSNGVSDPKLNEIQLNQPKQETLEEAKKRILDSNYMNKNDADIFEMGAKWQAARLYDVEEVYSIVRMCLGMKESGKTDIEIGACLERYRKK